MIRAVVSLLLGACLAPALQAQPFLSRDEQRLAYPDVHERRPVERLSRDEGLSQATVSDIIQDQQGFMWIGTHAGLNTYDGYRFTVYRHDPDDPNSISDDWINFVKEDRQGDLWIATGDGGLNRFDRSTGQFKRYRHDPGDPHSLSGAHVAYLFEDRSGTIWIETRDGLNRYDAEADHFTQYRHDPDDPETLSGPSVLFLHEDAAGLLWITVDVSDGLPPFLDRMDPRTGRITRLRHDPDDSTSIGGDHVAAWSWNGPMQSLLEDSQGRIWIGTTQDNHTAPVINRYDTETGRFTRYAHDPAMPSGLGAGGPGQILEDHQGRIWAVTWGSGLNRYDPEADRFIHYPTPALEAGWSLDIAKMVEDRSGQFWLITVAEDSRSEGQDVIRLARFDPQSGQFFFPTPDPSDPTVPNVELADIKGEDEERRLWFYASGLGMDQYDPNSNSFIHYAHEPNDPYSLGSNTVNRLFVDRTGVLWLGHPSAGLSKIDPRPAKFLHITHDPSDPGSLSSSNVWTFYEDRAGELWVGTTGGMDHYNAATGRFDHHIYLPVVANRSYPTNEIQAFLEDHTGHFWVGTNRGGVALFDRQTDTFIPVPLRPEEPDFLPGISDLLEDQEGVVWVGTYRGLFRHDRATNSFTHFEHDPEDSTSLSGNSIYALHEDANGQLWVATEVEGLNRFDPATETFTVFRHDPADSTTLSSSYLLDITQLPDDPDHLWVATYHGLNRFDIATGTARRFTTRNSGLPENIICAVVPDAQGYLWVSTNSGLARFDPRTETFRTYDTDDGLQSKEFNYTAAYRAPGGALYFGGINGFNVVVPGQLEDDLQPPPVALTRLWIYNAGTGEGRTYPDLQQEDDERRLRLPYEENDLTFEYAALHYANPEKNRYRYRLEPYEAAWSASSPEHQTRYANLDPGSYVFRVQASNSDDVWNEEGPAFRVEILPPWWRTVWAYLLYGLLLVGGVLAVDRVQRRRLLRKAEEQARIERAELEAEASAAQARALEEENRRKEVELAKAKELEYAFSALQEAHDGLKRTQDRLIQQEKLASLGALTAGIAHEIKNPLNFINNFSEIVAELSDELKDLLGPHLDAGLQDEADDFRMILADLGVNAEQIRKHGMRADGIVHAMMQHASGGTGQREWTDVNALVSEHIDLAYHGKRAQVPDFSCEIERDLGEKVGAVEMVPQEIGRVLLNLLGNAFDAVGESGEEGMATGEWPLGNDAILQRGHPVGTRRAVSAHSPTVTVTTRREGHTVEIRVSDNGPGIPAAIRQKIFEPFFTTKPTGSGTGLGLSLSYDIVTQGHGGTLVVESTEGEGATFTITLPVTHAPTASDA